VVLDEREVEREVEEDVGTAEDVETVEAVEAEGVGDARESDVSLL